MDEHGEIDIPESLDKIFEITKAKRVHYMGYSMGANVYIIMCNKRPDLATKMASFLAMAPAIYMTNMRPLAALLDRLKIPVNRKPNRFDTLEDYIRLTFFCI